MRTQHSRVGTPQPSAPIALRTSVLAAGIVAGAVLGVWLTEASLGPSAEVWISYHQAIRMPYSVLVPPLGLVAIIGAVATLVRSGGRVYRPAIVLAVICLLVGMAITVMVHFPMNAAIDSWPPTMPPEGWERVRHDWLVAHSVRSVLAVAAFGLLIAAPRTRERGWPGRFSGVRDERTPHAPAKSSATALGGPMHATLD